METKLLRRLAINDDVDAEFSYWKDQFVFSAWLAVGFAGAAAAAIALWPEDGGNSALRSFTRQLWPVFVECAFWLGFLLGLLWGAAKRAGSVLSGTMPWLPQHRLTRRAAAARFSGQWAVFFALAASLLWVTRQFISPGAAATAVLFSTLTLLLQVCLWSAAACLLAAIAGRERRTGA